ncbi:MAG: hypothetical protein A3D24_03020 [Candidatus Blackburnbacteria bacterium RIFCSPHIGHO2_02_FULL_39_13]|uniref:Uncharacterized protein n=1 Tax=Candidatus Blackburnbacteria bacterium RIFCSPLOWO2_01_FULL_40_20 TaxID=1797519 RepID=A0A1G1VB44_9BACT|nr:MAG: hypothetical protein UT38_C0012G0009 [Microgenomates group bacterium GW2011_GWA2_39_19]OGY07454.1 MAG: hypothetical protein A2694_00330 [Candidatus Blackburnbacteria bacterium RIFCSPHIGHO2_01_FULL_40_17]OGY08454.1 MAG: hypothetical protein A3D24_03020 [Candidatus Blackburnbacteria bacterium RIFCSPHIGHO2_02_FULL_39_13]OGY12629.1 MAG: hypothetical protein A3A77_05115 [Candidatus Blackburnbacteria bacterium RIFCSPLOWO2_01_FULL_40_20]OGY14916.1 MAG: hypothetical protein A3I52_02585 [Candida
MSATKRKNVNLLPSTGFEHSQTGKLLNWLLTGGRVIVICTEIVVIGAFFSRFWLDKTLTDLYEQNNLKKAQIEASSVFESEFKALQTRINIIKSSDATKLDASIVTKNIASVLPPGVVLTNISIANGEVILKGNSLSEGGLVGLMKALEGRKDFKNPILSNIGLETLGQQLIGFTIKFNTEKEGKSK